MNESDEAGERAVGSGVRTQKTDGTLLGRSRMEKEGQGDDREGSDSDYDLVPSGDGRGIGKWDIGCDSGQDGDRSGRLGGSEDG